MTTNEFSRRQQVGRFVDSRAKFLEKWKLAREEGKKFKPSATAIAKYENSDRDLSIDMSTEDLKAAYEQTLEQQNGLKQSLFQDKTLKESILKIMDPNKYDINGNKQKVSLKRPDNALTYSKKTSNWAFKTVEEQEQENETL